MVHSVEDVGVGIMPGPPEKFDAKDVIGKFKQEVANGDSKWLRPPLELEPGHCHIGGVVKARVWRERGREGGRKGGKEGVSQ